MTRVRLQPSSPAKYFFAVTQSAGAYHSEAERLIQKKLGSLDLHSDIFSFSDFSTYYDRELGGHCWKYLVSLKSLLPADRIADCKLLTEGIEDQLAVHSENSRKRTVNIDPGFVNGWQVVLASVKNHAHRLYIREGVYCEVTLIYREKEFRPLPWTYQDYLNSPVLEFLYRLRRDWAKQLDLS